MGGAVERTRQPAARPGEGDARAAGGPGALTAPTGPPRSLSRPDPYAKDPFTYAVTAIAFTALALTALAAAAVEVLS